MSQNSKKTIGALSFRFNTTLGVLVVTIALASSSVAIAQNQFAPRTDFQQSNFQQPNLGGWTPPNTAGSFHRDPATSNSSYNTPATNQPSGVSFPETIAPFETGIRTANFEAPAHDFPADPSITDRIDGAAATLSKWKDIADEKANAMLGGENADGNWLDKIKSFIGSSNIGKMLGSLALVLGLYFAFVWVMRKSNFGGNSGLPPEIVEVMGQVPFGARRSLQLVRLGSKMLLLLNSPEGTQPLGEITDPVEVEHLASLVQGKRRSRSRQPAAAAVQQAAAQLTGNTAQPTGNVGATNLNEVVRILQQAAQPQQQLGRAVFEA